MSGQLPMSRRDHLKNYFLAVVMSGELRGSPSEMAAQAAAIFAEDLPAALSQLTGQFGSTMTSALIGKLGDVVADVRRQGLRKFWAGIKAQYDRGVEAKYGKR